VGAASHSNQSPLILKGRGGRMTTGDDEDEDVVVVVVAENDAMSKGWEGP
jgi:hypothetical protein